MIKLGGVPVIPRETTNLVDWVTVSINWTVVQIFPVSLFGIVEMMH